nr:MAG TPA: hypothetical protein [Caudoviricetes sp.]
MKNQGFKILYGAGEVICYLFFMYFSLFLVLYFAIFSIFFHTFHIVGSILGVYFI